MLRYEIGLIINRMGVNKMEEKTLRDTIFATIGRYVCYAAAIGSIYYIGKLDERNNRIIEAENGQVLSINNIEYKISLDKQGKVSGLDMLIKTPEPKYVPICLQK